MNGDGNGNSCESLYWFLGQVIKSVIEFTDLKHFGFH